jgi:hypothetical protein
LPNPKKNNTNLNELSRWSQPDRPAKKLRQNQSVKILVFQGVEKTQVAAYTFQKPIPIDLKERRRPYSYSEDILFCPPCQGELRGHDEHRRSDRTLARYPIRQCAEPTLPACARPQACLHPPDRAAAIDWIEWHNDLRMLTASVVADKRAIPIQTGKCTDDSDYPSGELCVAGSCGNQ